MNLRKIIREELQKVLNEDTTISINTDVINQNHTILGAIVDVSFSEFPGNFLAKNDTGADTSSIHCENHYIEGGVVFCKILDNKKFMKFKNFENRLVKNSDGKEKNRPCIKLNVSMGDKKFFEWFTLNNREDMKYPIIIGKNILKNKFLIDASKDKQ